MPVKFAIFSTDKSPSLNPWAYDPAPNVFIDLGEDPVHGTVDTWAGSRGRGSRIQTLGGVVDQDFGVVIQDEQIRIAVQNYPV